MNDSGTDGIDGNDAARYAHATLMKGLDSARRVVEQTRLLLSGNPCQGDALVTGGAQAPCETVQNPEAE